jgi:hypothetical protein
MVARAITSGNLSVALRDPLKSVAKDDDIDESGAVDFGGTAKRVVVREVNRINFREEQRGEQRKNTNLLPRGRRCHDQQCNLEAALLAVISCLLTK